MIEALIKYLNLKVKSVFAEYDVLCLVEKKKSEENEFPAEYISGGELRPIDFDSHKGTIYFRLNGEEKIEEVEEELSSGWEKHTYPLRAVLFAPRSIIGDDGFAANKLGDNLSKIIRTPNNKVLNTLLKSDYCTIQVSGVKTDVIEDEYSGTIPKIGFEYCLIAVDFEIEVTGTPGCWEYWCNGDTISVDDLVFTTDKTCCEKIMDIIQPEDVEENTVYGYKDGEFGFNPAGSSGTWGSITGTLSDQLDLQAALDAKQDSLGYTPYDATNPNGYITLAESRAGQSETIAGITYNNITGAWTLGAGYTIPTTSQINQGTTAYGWGDHNAMGYLIANSPITGATKTKITYDSNGLVISGANATTADIASSLNKRYVTDAQLVVIGNTSGTNTGDQDLSGYLTGITGAMVTTALGYTPYNATNPSGYLNAAAAGALYYPLSSNPANYLVEADLQRDRIVNGSKSLILDSSGVLSLNGNFFASYDANGNFVLGNGSAVEITAVGQTAINAATTGADGAVAIGNSAIAGGLYDVALGISANTFTSAGNSIAIGYNASTIGPESIAIGSGAQAGTDGTAVGFGTIATGTSSVALGETANATGQDAIAIGVSAVASHNISIAIGSFATTTKANQFIIPSTYVFTYPFATASTLLMADANKDIVSVTLSGLTLTGTTLSVVSGGGSPLTTKGDLYTYSTTNTRLGVGANDYLLIADSTQATGLRWATQAEVRTALGLVIGTNVQAYDADLSTWAGLTPTTVGQNLVTLTNPSAVSWIRINADNTVTARTAAETLADIGAQAAGSYQPLDSDLTTIAGLTATTDNFMVSVSSAWASRTPAQVRTTLGLVIGTNVQAYDADLDTWAGITPGANVGTFLATPSSANLAAAVTGETGTGALVFGTNPTIAKPVLDATNPTHQSYSPGGAGTATLDCSLANQHFINMPAGNITIALSNITNNQTILIGIKQDSVGSRTVTWFSGITWQGGGTAPALSTTANAVDYIGIRRTGSGTYDGFLMSTGDPTSSSGANTALSNLASVAINAALIPSSAAGLDFGSTAKPWKDIWLAGSSGTPGTNQFKITGASTSGVRTITLPDASGTLLYSGGPLGTPSSGTLTNCTFPTLNQNTTGSAASLSISGQTGLMTFTGLASTSRIKTVRDAADTILELGGNYTPTGTWTSLTMVTPVLGTPTSGTLTNCTGLPVAAVVAGTFAAGAFKVPSLNYVNNAVSVASNAGTVPISSNLNTFTNSSAANMTITMAVTSAVDGQRTIVRIYDFNGVAKTITWVNTENSSVSAPTTSNGSTTLPRTVEFQFNGQTSLWRCIRNV